MTKWLTIWHFRSRINWQKYCCLGWEKIDWKAHTKLNTFAIRYISTLIRELENSAKRWNSRIFGGKGGKKGEKKTKNWMKKTPSCKKEEKKNEGRKRKKWKQLYSFLVLVYMYRSLEEKYVQVSNVAANRGVKNGGIEGCTRVEGVDWVEIIEVLRVAPLDGGQMWVPRDGWRRAWSRLITL